MPKDASSIGPPRPTPWGGDARSEERLLVALARPTLAIAALGAAADFIPGVSPAPQRGALAVGALAVLTALSYLLAKKGAVRLGSWLYIIGLLAITTDSFATYGGFRGVSGAGFVVVVTVAGLLRGWLAGLITAGLSMALVVALLVVEVTGLVELPLFPTTDLAAMGLLLAIIAISSAYLWVALRQRSEAMRATSEAAESAQRSERRVSRLLHESPDGFLSLSDDGRILDCNVRMASLVGLRRRELLGKTLGDISSFSSVAEDSLRRAIDAAGEGSEAALVELELEGGDGNRRFVEAHAKVMEGQDRGPTVLLIVRDVTSRWEAQREAESLQRERREAHRLESLGRLAGGIAHDFNNMLLVVIANAELLLVRGELSERSRAQVEQIHEAGDRAAALTRQLLAFARRQVLTPKVVDLASALREMETFLSRLMPETIEVEVTVAGELPPVRIDLSQMEQVLVNLAVNARDAMPQGGCLSIRADEVDLDERFCERHPPLSPGLHVRISVRDDGEGIADEALDRIFEPFFSTKGGGGTGLGLATVHGIVAQSGGAISASSAPGRGATFTIHLPVSTELVLEKTKTPSAPAVPSRGETLLVVDDEPVVRAITEQILETAGYRVLVAKGGVEALELAGNHDGPIELLLTDVVMRGMGGKRLAETLTAERPDTRVLFMSGYARNEGADGGGILEDGAPLLAKPFDATTLLETTRSLLDRRRS